MDDFQNVATRNYTVPDILDLTQYMTYVQEWGMTNPLPIRYKLINACFHIGATVNSGHYTSATTGPMLDGQTPPRRQYEINDRWVTDETLDDGSNYITNPPGDHTDWKPYYLWYERIPKQSLWQYDDAVFDDETGKDVGANRKGKRKRSPSTSF